MVKGNQLFFELEENRVVHRFRSNRGVFKEMTDFDLRALPDKYRRQTHTHYHQTHRYADKYV